MPPVLGKDVRPYLWRSKFYSQVADTLLFFSVNMYYYHFLSCKKQIYLVKNKKGMN